MTIKIITFSISSENHTNTKHSSYTSVVLFAAGAGLVVSLTSAEFLADSAVWLVEDIVCGSGVSSLRSLALLRRLRRQ